MNVDRSKPISMTVIKSKVYNYPRFGHLYWKLKPEMILPANSTSEDWISSRLLRKTAFNTE